MPAATGFFVAVPLNEELFVPYVITARHVLDKSRPYGNLYVRINRKEGGFEDFEAPQDEWTTHLPTDVAVCRVAISIDDFDLLAPQLNVLATDEYVQSRSISEGDEVFFVGMFSQHPGMERNQPIVRFGNISLMPREKIQVELSPGASSVPIDAYLVEARSWGGHSGSPAFVYFPPDRQPGRIIVGQSEVVLLGLVHGHYEIEQDVAFIGDVLGSGKVPVNAGIAVVVPAQKIIDTLMQPELVEERRRVLEQSRS